MTDAHDDSKDPAEAPAGAIATPDETRRTLLRGQARGYTQVRNLLVQIPEKDEAGSRASVLARAVTDRRRRELLLYLLLLGSWPVVDYHQERMEPEARRAPLPSNVWIRALTEPGRPAMKPSALSTAWSNLTGMRLVERKRKKRATWVSPCREDGTGQPYRKPTGGGGRESYYFILPDEFWHSGLFAKLTLPGLAMFLLFLKETSDAREFQITTEHIEAWYGISRRSAQNGIDDLEAHGILFKRYERVSEPLSAVGFTDRIHYRLLGEYSYESRAALRKAARSAVRRRAAADAAEAIDGKSPSVPRGTLKKPRARMVVKSP